jgi:hypothetical protein
MMADAAFPNSRRNGAPSPPVDTVQEEVPGMCEFLGIEAWAAQAMPEPDQAVAIIFDQMVAETAVLVEQTVASAMKIADRVIIMNNGQIVFDGLVQEARDSNFWNYF